nr:hypothetical protein Iba_chr14eCG3030 [Ipomoea batatas]
MINHLSCCYSGILNRNNSILNPVFPCTCITSFRAFCSFNNTPILGFMAAPYLFGQIIPILLVDFGESSLLSFLLTSTGVVFILLLQPPYLVLQLSPDRDFLAELSTSTLGFFFESSVIDFLTELSTSGLGFFLDFFDSLASPSGAGRLVPAADLVGEVGLGAAGLDLGFLVGRRRVWVEKRVGASWERRRKAFWWKPGLRVFLARNRNLHSRQMKLLPPLARIPPPPNRQISRVRVGS